MNNLFDGMLLWEIILLLLGIVLFLTIIGGFVYLLKKDKLKVSFAGFFLIPIIMIAFPSIRYVSFWNGFFEFNTLTEKAEENPEDTESLKKLEEIVSEKASNRIRSDEQLAVQARANTVLENYDEAGKQVDKLLESNPKNEEAHVIKSRIEVAKAQKQLEVDSTNVEARKMEEENIKVLESQTKITKFDKILIGKAVKARQQ